MVTFHPTTRRSHNGYLAVVMLRNARGQCVGSNVSASVFESEQAAKERALRAAHSVAGKLEFTRVREAV